MEPILLNILQNMDLLLWDLIIEDLEGLKESLVMLSLWKLTSKIQNSF